MNEPNYQDAFEELQQIVTDMEQGQITVDELTDKVSRAAALIKICKNKLHTAEQNVQEILSTIENQEIMDESGSAATSDEQQPSDDGDETADAGDNSEEGYDNDETSGE